MKLRLLYAVLFCTMFVGISAQDTIGIVGTATPNEWAGPDIVMTEVADTVGLFTVNTTLKDGVAKFRVNNDWAVNWGNDTFFFPSGTGYQDQDNIPVFAGDYNIFLDTISGAYSFNVISEIGIIGDAIPGNTWSEDLNMYEDSAGIFFIELDLVPGGIKFRKDDDWAVNWGKDTFPSGFADLNSDDNIPVDQAGEYRISFDTMTGFFNFEEVVTYTSIGIIGSATANGWDDPDQDLTQNESDPNVWEGNITLGEGEIKFRANDAWAVSWGGPAEFPMDTAMMTDDNITVIPGEYLVSFNTETAIFNFQEVIIYESIGIYGDAVDGWEAEADRDMLRSETDSAEWSLRTILGDGELKFRANDAWDVSWAAVDFPSGVGLINDFINIPITAGEYQITFNTTTRAYHFEELVVFSTVAIVGTATPLMSWDEDVDMDQDADDEQLWTITSDLVVGEMKFRAEDDWVVNWGNDDQTLTGIGLQDKKNILIVEAGTYFISLRSDDGMYAIQEPSSVHTQSILKDIKIYPNPSDNFINIEMSPEVITGKVNIEIIDVTGKRVSMTSANANTNIRLDVSTLIPGNYFVKMYNDSFLVAKPISVK